MLSASRLVRARANAFHYAVCLVALAVYAWAFYGQLHVGALPTWTEPGSQQQPVSIDGDPAGTPAQIRFLAQRHPPGTPIEVEAAGQEFRVLAVPAFSPLHLWITFITGFFFWSIAAFVFAGRARLEWARVLFWGTLSYGMAIMAGGVYFPPPPLWPGVARPLLRTSAMILTGTLFVHLGLVFPTRSRILVRQGWLLYLLYAFGLAVMTWHGWALVSYFDDPGRPGWRALKTADTVASGCLVAIVLAGSLLMWRSVRTAQLTRERQQTKWLWWGITVGVAPFIFLYLLPRLLGIPEILPLFMVRLVSIVIPAAFAVAVVRYQFMDIDLIIRRSIIYGALAATLVVVYIVSALLIGQRIVHFAEAERYLPFVAALTAVALFGPTRHWLGQWVDRTLFKIRYDYRNALQSYRESIARASAQAEAADLLLSFLARTLSPRKAAVALEAGGEVVVGGHLERQEAIIWMERLGRTAEPVEAALAAVGATSLPEIESDSLATNDSSVRLIQPLVSGGRRLGAIFLGEKESERRYIEQDLELLEGAASITATALERMDLVQKVAEEKFINQRLDELNRMKTDFLMMVLHDLINPVSSIKGTTENLLDGVVGPITDRQRECLYGTKFAVRELDRLIKNLLEIAELKEGRAWIDPGPVPLSTTVKEAVESLRPNAEARRLRLRIDCPPDLGCVTGDRQKLLQVVINLIENAIKYSPVDGEISVIVRRTSSGEQELAVCDSGQGITPGEEKAIFERFRQGSRAARSQKQGFGIGLYIVKTFVELLGGVVEAANRPEGGARFTCRLREWSTVGESVTIE